MGQTAEPVHRSADRDLSAAQRPKRIRRHWPAANGVLGPGSRVGAKLVTVVGPREIVHKLFRHPPGLAVTGTSRHALRLCGTRGTILLALLGAWPRGRTRLRTPHRRGLRLVPAVNCWLTAMAIVWSSTRASRSCSDGSFCRAARSRTPVAVSGPSPHRLATQFVIVLARRCPGVSHSPVRAPVTAPETIRPRFWRFGSRAVAAWLATA